MVVSSFSQSSYHQSHPAVATTSFHQQGGAGATGSTYYDSSLPPSRYATQSVSPSKQQGYYQQQQPQQQQPGGGGISYSLGFRLDEHALATKNAYVVKWVEPGTPSAMAGLKEGDKITKINGRSTQSMPYDEFCREIMIAQQQQMRNNMIHLMVMRKSAKSTGTATYTATTTTPSTSSSMMTSPPPPQPPRFHAPLPDKTSYVDEGYVPGSGTSSTSSANNNLISVVKINQYGTTSATTPQFSTNFSSSNPLVDLGITFLPCNRLTIRSF